jgi:oligosaccharide repeat unit polymerase
VFYTLVIKALISFASLASAYGIVFGQRRWLFFLSSLAVVFMDSLLGMGRFRVFELLVYVCAFVLFKRAQERSGKARRRRGGVWLLLLVLVAYAASVTVQRDPGVENTTGLWLSLGELVSRQVVIYFTGPFNALDQMLSSSIPRQLGLAGGRATFGGVGEIVNLFIQAMGADHITFNGTIAPITQAYIHVGPSVRFNAFYTVVMNMYLDWGVAGILVFPFLYGFASGLAVYRWVVKPGPATALLAVFNFYVSIASSFRWLYQFPENIVLLTVLLLWGAVAANRESGSMPALPYGQT